jgi:hypothetical protein
MSLSEAAANLFCLIPFWIFCSSEQFQANHHLNRNLTPPLTIRGVPSVSIGGRAAGFYTRLSQKATNYASVTAPTFIK